MSNRISINNVSGEKSINVVTIRENEIGSVVGSIEPGKEMELALNDGQSYGISFGVPEAITVEPAAEAPALEVADDDQANEPKTTVDSDL